MEKVFRRDLVGIVELSKRFAQDNGLEITEACDYVVSEITGHTEPNSNVVVYIPVYCMKTDKAPLHWRGSYGAMAAEFVYNSRWWESPEKEAEINNNWKCAPNQIGITWIDAEKLFSYTREMLNKTLEFLDPPRPNYSANLTATVTTNQNQANPDSNIRIKKWPWGNHETELLRHLSAAAEKFWTLYDPEDITTAPTNEQVTEWLVSEGVSKRIAEAIAQILRTDGLRTGPRK